MNDAKLNRVLMQKVRPKFYGHDTLKCKYRLHIPETAEREYVRLSQSYMDILKNALENEMPALMDEYKKQLDEQLQTGVRNDSIDDLETFLIDMFNSLLTSIVSKEEGFGLRRKLEKMAHLNRKLTVKEWKRAVHATLGINILEDYYMGDFYKEHMTEWVDRNVNLISTIPQDSLGKMKDIVLQGYLKGRLARDMKKDIMSVYDVSARHAELIARDQTVKLCSAITRAQQEDAGIYDYVWSTSQDERVRDSHRALEGKKFMWKEPPMNSDGRACHPGEDYNCRCVALPVFNQDIELPWMDEDNKVQYGYDKPVVPIIKPIRLFGGKGSAELNDVPENWYLPSRIRKNLPEYEKIRTYNDIKSFFAQKGIEVDTDIEKLKMEMQNEDIDTIRKLGQKLAVAYDTYEETFGKGCLNKLKKIKIGADDEDAQAAYYYNKIGENDPDAGTLKIAELWLSGKNVYHELAHALQDSLALDGEDTVKCAERIVKEAELDPKAKAYFGAKAENIEAERMADAFGWGFTFGKKENVAFINAVRRLYAKF